MSIAWSVRMAALWGIVAGGCGDRSGTEAATTTTGDSGVEPAETETGTGTGDPDFEESSACMRSADCIEATGGSAGHCVAPYDPGLAERGEARCVRRCIEPDDLTRWCTDDGSCCEGSSCSRVDGFCLPRSTGSTGSFDETGGDETDGSQTSGQATSGPDGTSTGGTGP